MSKKHSRSEQYTQGTYKELINEIQHYEQSSLCDFTMEKFSEYEVEAERELHDPDTSMERIRYAQGILVGIKRGKLMTSHLLAYAQRGTTRAGKNKEQDAQG